MRLTHSRYSKEDRSHHRPGAARSTLEKCENLGTIVGMYSFAVQKPALHTLHCLTDLLRGACEPRVARASCSSFQHLHNIAAMRSPYCCVMSVTSCRSLLTISGTLAAGIDLVEQMAVTPANGKPSVPAMVTLTADTSLVTSLRW